MRERTAAEYVAPLRVALQRRRWLGWLLGLLAGFAQAQPALEVGVEDIPYLPFHDFNSTPAQGYVAEVLTRFAAAQGRELRLQPLPIKRLARLRESGDAHALYYPDNPHWHEPALAQRRAYSLPLARIIGATMVRPDAVAMPREAFRVLALPRGFTPIEWRGLIDSGQVRTLEAADARAALGLVLIGRADGADVEFNVAQHLLQRMGRPRALVLGEQLPLATITLHVSSADPALIAAFDRFLREQEAALSALRQHYGIVESVAAARAQSAPAD